MKRSSIAIPLLVLTTALFTPSAATGAPPVDVDLAETFKAGDACEFPIMVATFGKSGQIALPNNPKYPFISTSPTLRVTVTNLETDETVTVNATGTFRVTAEGTIEAGGHNFLYGVPEVGAGALATTGPIVVELDKKGEIASINLSGAQVRDICAELA
jgi:hypothetical protein